jgi:hypothetical protein
VIAAGDLACDTISSVACVENAQCDDGNPCNGVEICAATGSCIRRTSDCGPPPECQLFYCDTTGAEPVCALRRSALCGFDR